ncbi:MAG: TIGR04282 family arsenosugar biosynthesis glycosyltransferase [Anaerolineae bacterium]
MKRALIVVAKEPQAGQTKTRLTPPLEPHQAAALYRCLMLDTFQLMARVPGVDAVISFAPDTAEAYFRAIAPDGFHLVPQRGSDLGERLDNVLREHLNDGYAQAVVMNSDGPTLPTELVALAFHTLDDPLVDVVLGPSEDGGYYLIGLKIPCGHLFDLTMSTPRVLQETTARACEAGLNVALLSSWYDIDRWEDVLKMAADLERLPAHEASHTRRFLAELNSWCP